MVLLVLTILVAVAAVRCEGGYEGVAPYYNYEGAYAPEYKNYQPRDYHFDYFVSDPHTGDHKSQWEVKEKGVVRGGYSLLEPDGTTRVVEYVADEHGFRAAVSHIGNPVHPAPAYYAPAGAYNGRYENYYPAQQQPQQQQQERVEYHGFTGNDGDDSAYTRYGGEESGVPYQQPILYFLRDSY